jgi:hypothetical protein
MKTEKKLQSEAREAALAKACADREARIKADNDRRAMFRGIRNKLLDLAALASGLECEWKDTHNLPLFGDKAEAERRVLTANSAIDWAEEYEKHDVVKLAKKGT